MTRLLPGTTEQHTRGVISRGSVMLFPNTISLAQPLNGRKCTVHFFQSSRTKRSDGQFVEW